MSRAQPLMLAGTCPVCRDRQETEAPKGANGRPRLTDRRACSRPRCAGMVSFRRQPRSGLPTPAPAPADGPARKVKRYRVDELPAGRSEPASQAPPDDAGAGDVQGTDPATGATGQDGSTGTQPEPVTVPELDDQRARRRRYRGTPRAELYPGTGV